MDQIQLLKFFSAFVFVISLMLLLGWAARRFGYGGASPVRGGKRRLKVVEVLPLDPRRKLVLIARDEQQHLLLLGPGGETVIERGVEGGITEEKVVTLTEKAA